MNSLTVLLTHELRRLFRDRKIFLVALTAAALVGTGTWLRAGEYRAASREYHMEQFENDAEITRTGELNRLYDMAPPQVPPQPMAVFHEGVPLVVRDVGTTEATVHEAAFNANPLARMFPPLDFTTVVIWVLGLLTLLMASLTLSGEREGGTFELLVTAGASSRQLVLAKWLAILIGTSAILVLCILTAWLFVIAAGLSMPHSTIAEFLLSSLASLLYLGTLAALGIALSSKSASRARVMASSTG